MAFPWLEATIAVPALGAFWVRAQTDPDAARRQSLILCGVTLLGTLVTWIITLVDGNDGRVVAVPGLRGYLVVDDFNAPLLALAALHVFLTVLATLRTKLGQFSFGALLLTEAILLATLAAKDRWLLAILLVLGTVLPWWEMRGRHRPARVYISHMVLFAVLLFAGMMALAFEGRGRTVGTLLLLTAILIRGGVAPLHCWLIELLESASLGTALVFVTPMLGGFAAVRLLMPIAPDWLMRLLGILALSTAFYAAGMSLVQRDSRRFFGYLVLSHSSVVLFGLTTTTAVGLAGGLCIWLSAWLSLLGFGLTLRSVEARAGRLSLGRFHGLYEHTAPLATLFLLTGLASIGFPGTVGFVGADLLVDGSVANHVLFGVVLVIVAALNGLAVLHAYFRIFTGVHFDASIDLRGRPTERVAVLILAALIFGGGLWPQPGVRSRYDAATRLLAERQRQSPAEDDHAPGVAQAGAPGNAAERR